MIPLPYDEYFDRVWGCWLGKCVAGTLGAPYEGMKQLLDLEFRPEMVASMLPNDDLDLQVLWLDVLERKGAAFTSDDLAEAFFTCCPYAPGEYAVFKKNWFRGIHPPLSGAFNNFYYRQGMGCPIRSEIWACVAPGNPALAASFASRDGVLDHEGESVLAERFLAALESAAFVTSDKEALYEAGFDQIPAGSKIASLLRDTLAWCRGDGDWRMVRARILRKYGHPDCTNLFQNMGITLLALELCGDDLIETSMTALNCGFDTDCTCATAGSVLGILQGGKALCERHGLTDPDYVLGVNTRPRELTASVLARDTCAVGVRLAETANKAVSISGITGLDLPVFEPAAEVAFRVDYNGRPAMGPGETRRLVLHVSNLGAGFLQGEVVIGGPEGWECRVDGPASLELAPGTETTVAIEVAVPADLPVLWERNLFDVRLDMEEGPDQAWQFGVTGAAVWNVFGPFWENIVTVPHLGPGEGYFQHLPGGTPSESVANVRAYHLSTYTDPGREYMTIEDIITGGVPDDPATMPEPVCVHEDRFSVNDLVGFDGPCTVYAHRRLVSPEDRVTTILIGRSDAVTLWVNGELLATADNHAWWNGENMHVLDVKLRAGINDIVLRLARRSGCSHTSIIYTTKGTCTDQYADFGSAL
jgi:hypothetical protein